MNMTWIILGFDMNHDRLLITLDWRQKLKDRKISFFDYITCQVVQLILAHIIGA